MAWPKEYSTEFLEEQVELLKEHIEEGRRFQKKNPEVEEFALSVKQGLERLKVVEDELESRK